MAQMVLPQNLPSSANSEAGQESASSRRADKSGDSRFDEVSRAERRRLEDARASRSDSAQEKKPAVTERAEDKGADKLAESKTDSSANNASKTDSERPDATNPDKNATTDAPPKVEYANLAQGVDKAPELLADVAAGADGEAPMTDEMDPLLAVSDDPATDAGTSVPGAITFAGLQTLVLPAEALGQGAAKAASMAAAPAAANAQGNPFIQGVLASVTGLNGAGGKNGPLNGQTAGQSGSTTNLALTESMLAGLSSDSGKASDSPILQNAIRFQGTLDMVSQQANSLNAPRMAPENSLLRGYATSIDVPVSHAEWGDKMAGKLTWLTARNMSVAEIHLTPPDMGPMEVKVHVQQDQANITVHSANPVVREQLELHSHRLRDMLSDQGFSLEKFDVSDSGNGQAQDSDADGGEGGDGREGPTLAELESDDPGGQPQSLDLTWKGEVDIFA